MPSDPIISLNGEQETACSAARRARRRDALRPFSVTRPGGVLLDGVETGDPAGTPILLLHGLSDSWCSFTPLMSRLPSDRHVVAFSQRWHGDSRGRREVFSIEAMAADAAAVIESRCGGAAFVVGHCMGGNIALRLATARRELVRGLCLINSFATLKGNPLAEELADAIETLGGEKPDRAFISAFQASSIEGPVSDAFFQMIVDESAKAPGALWPAAMAAMTEFDATPRLGAITAPTLVLYGDRDALLPPAEHHRLAESVNGARAVRLAGRGHSPHWEEPARVARELDAFVEALS